MISRTGGAPDRARHPAVQPAGQLALGGWVAVAIGLILSLIEAAALAALSRLRVLGAGHGQPGAASNAMQGLSPGGGNGILRSSAIAANLEELGYGLSKQ